MNLKLGRISLSLGAAIVVMLIGVGCSTAPSPSGPLSITKVNPYHLTPGMHVDTTDPMIKFEQRHHLRGAVTSDEYVEKFGDYYTVFWKSKTPGVPVTVRFEYRQAKSGSEVKQIDAQVTSKKRNTTKFRVNGNFYKEGGAVTQWRALILQDGKMVSESRSFLWK